MKGLFKNIESIIEQTIELLPQALSGDVANRTFFVKPDGTVDYHYYQGQIILDDNCFYTIKDYETPDPDEFGYESLEDMDFDACGFAEQIENSIENHLNLIEQ